MRRDVGLEKFLNFLFLVDIPMCVFDFHGMGQDYFPKKCACLQCECWIRFCNVRGTCEVKHTRCL